MNTETQHREQDYSASVRLELRAQGRMYDLAQVGEGTMILRHPAIVPPGPAEIVVVLDGVMKAHSVVLYPHAPDHEADEVFFW
jgi:hypothetical protein